MTVSDLYLTCFVVGFLLSALSVLMGGFNLHLHLPFHLHIPGHVDVPHLHVPHPHVHVPHGAHVPAADTEGVGMGPAPVGLPLINFFTIAAFLAWFGGAGFLLTRYSHVVAVLSLLLAIAAGVTGAALILGMVNKVMVASEHPLTDEEFEMVGVLGRVSNSIRAGGTGELIYSQAGTRRVCGARSDTGKAINKGSEVVVTRYEKGLAYVRTWEELEGSEGLAEKERM